MFTKEQLEAAYKDFKNVAVIEPAKPRRGEKTFNLDKALYNRPERRGTVRGRGYVSPGDRTI